MNNTREKSFLKNTIIITIGKFCTHLISFLLLPLYTNILSVQEYGIVDLLTVLTSLLLPIITFQVELAVFRELLDSRENENKKKEIISNGLITVTVQCIIYAIIYAIISQYIVNDYKIFLAINVIIAIFSSIFLQISRGIGNNKSFTIGSFISAFFTIILNIVFLVILNFRVKGMLIATFIGQLICCLYLFFSLKLYKYISINQYKPKVVKSLLKYSLPLVPNAISWWIFGASDRVVVTIFLGLTSTGLLSAANKLPALIITIYNIFYLSFSENILSNTKDLDIESYYMKMFNVILGVFLALSIGLVSSMPFVFPILINVKFTGAYNLIPFLIVANIFNIIVSMTGVLYSIYRNTKEIAKTAIIAAIINLLVHLSLIKVAGLYAAVISTFIAYLIMAVYRLYNAKKKYFLIKLNKSLIIKTLLILPIVLVLYYINNLYLNILSLILAIIYAININIKSLDLIIDIIKKKIK